MAPLPKRGKFTVVPNADNLKQVRQLTCMYSCAFYTLNNIGTGHSQYKGRRYCPFEPGQVSKEEWLRRVKLEHNATTSAPPQREEDDAGET